MANRSLPKACVILGAGASYDVRNEGSPTLVAEFQPPLARDLFNIEKHKEYVEVLQHYTGAQVLTQELAPLASSGQTSIENELRKYAEHPDSQVRQHFKHIPPYLRDLIYCASDRYTYWPSCYIQLVMELLAEHPHDILFIVLNYDNLLEKALNRFDQAKFQFSKITDYVGADRNAKVVKLHGSINWFRGLSGLSGAGGWDDTVAQADIFQPLPEDHIIVRDGVNIVRNWREGQQNLYPLLTAPLAGKGLADAVCPKSHFIAAQEFLKNCRKFLIIGTSGLDEDLLALLDSAVTYKPDGSNILIHLVDVNEAADKARANFQKGVRAFRPQLSTQSTFRDGFRVYVLQHLRDFATSPA